MNINTRDIPFVEFNGQDMPFVEFNGVIVYESWKKLIASGVPPLTLLNCKGVDDGKYLLNYKIFGESVQKTYSDDNLLDISRIENGTFDTSTGEAIESSYASQYRTTYFVELIKGSQLIQSNSFSNNIRMFCWDQDGNFISTSVISHNTPFTISTNCKAKFVSGSGGFPTNMEIKLTYIPPTPDTPIEVESVGEKTKNFIDINSMLNNVLVDNGDGSYTLTKISTGGRFSNTQEVFIPANTTLTLSLDVIDCTTSNKYNTILNARLRCTDNTDIYMSINKGKNFITKTIEKNVNRVSIYISPEDLVGEYTTFKNLQLEIGTTPTEYEPYGCRIPVKVMGINLYGGEFNKTFKLDNFITANTNIRATGDNISSQCYISLYDIDQNKISEHRLSSTNGNRRFTSITTTTDVYYVRFHNTELPNLSLVIGSTNEYEPYVEPITTNIYLNEPLRKINDITDYIDFNNKKVVRGIKEYIFNGNENITTAPTNKADKKRLYIPTIGTAYSENDKITVFCSHYPRITANDNYTCHTGCSGYDGRNRSAIYDDNYQTVDSFKAFLQEEYNNGNPVKIYGILETVIEETKELPNIPTFKGTTIIEVDTNIQPSNLEVVYKGKR